MACLNRVMIIGHLGKDPEFRATAASAVCNFTVATSERFKDRDGNQQERTEWHRIVAWGKLAELARDYLAKGRQVYVEGSLETREWTDKDGVKRYTTEIKAREILFLGERGGGSQQRTEQTAQAPRGAQQPQAGADTYDDIPF
jgi:single-strand DNA-binding protein